MPEQTSLDIGEIRARLRGATGKDYWRSLEALADTPEFQSFVAREFPQGQALQNTPISRRRFLQLAAASLALAGMAACSPQPSKQIVPYVTKPDALIPGKPQFYATAHVLDGYATGILVESQTGRPIRIEGNPDHPASRGGIDVFAQASILSLYDPERAQAVRHNGQASGWDAFTRGWREVLGASGQGVRVLTTTSTSPTLAAQMARFSDQFPDAQWHQYEPINPDNTIAGAKLAFGRALTPVYQFENADVILALDDDFLFTDPGRLRYTRAFSDKRRVDADQVAMNRLYVVESTPSITGSMADHRLALRSSEVERFARALAERLGLAGAAPADLPESWSSWISALADDLTAHQGTSLVTAGLGQPPIVHALAAWINATLGGVGQTIRYIEPPVTQTDSQVESLRALTDAMQNGEVSALLIVGGNPAYDAPADIAFADGAGEAALQRAPQFVRRRNLGALRVGAAADPQPRNVGRRPRLRRHGDDPATADPAAVRHALGAASAGKRADRGRRFSAERSAACAGLLARCRANRRLRDLLANVAARWGGRGQRRRCGRGDTGRLHAAGRACCRRRAGTDRPPRSVAVGRTVQQQRLAARTAQAVH